jgi:hypothetical protein
MCHAMASDQSCQADQSVLGQIQSRGRARQANSSFTVLGVGEKARDRIGRLQQAEHHQAKVLANPVEVCSSWDTLDWS